MKQIALRGTPPEQVIDEQRERRAADGDAVAIATAIPDAVSGRL